MEHDAVYGKFILTVYVFDSVQFCIFAKNLPIAKNRHCHTASLFTVGIIKNIILSCFNFCES